MTLLESKFSDVIYLLGLMWVVYAVDLLLPINLTQFGIGPREVSGLPGIVMAPLIHAGLGHILANSLPFLVLGCILQMHGRAVFWQATIIIVLASGLCVWLFSGAGRVVGVSGVIFGYWAFLMAYACFVFSASSVAVFWRSCKSLLLGIIVLIFYGTMLFSFFDMRTHISWSGHFFGAVAGVLAAFILAGSAKAEALKYSTQQ
tara:strand:+ start:4301 stop:4909 length:609 start_codon:yes stop_codon:yes gene_type:complete